MLRREKKRGEIPEKMPDSEDIAKKTEDKDSVFRIHQVLHQMEEPYKEVFQLRVFGELSFAQIGGENHQGFPLSLQKNRPRGGFSTS